MCSRRVHADIDTPPIPGRGRSGRVIDDPVREPAPLVDTATGPHPGTDSTLRRRPHSCPPRASLLQHRVLRAPFEPADLGCGPWSLLWRTLTCWKAYGSSGAPCCCASLFDDEIKVRANLFGFRRVADIVTVRKNTDRRSTVHAAVGWEQGAIGIAGFRNRGRFVRHEPSGALRWQLPFTLGGRVHLAASKGDAEGATSPETLRQTDWRARQRWKEADFRAAHRRGNHRPVRAGRNSLVHRQRGNSRATNALGFLMAVVPDLFLPVISARPPRRWPRCWPPSGRQTSNRSSAGLCPNRSGFARRSRCQPR